MSSTAATWHEVELCFSAQQEYENPYLQGDLTAIFFGPGGERLVRPGFWDGENRWLVRFAPPTPGSWRWESNSECADPGFLRTGEFSVRAAEFGDGLFAEHGFWQMAPDARTLQHRDGTSALLAVDTAWALPWRATVAQVEEYAAYRAGQGFNAVLLMTLQPDMRAEGPDSREMAGGFARAFTDLQTGHINLIKPEYFQYFDQIVDVLIRHDIVPIMQPVFFGFGWKGLETLGPVLIPEEYVRYCRYLVARYGARPAIYLVGADGKGDEPAITAAGEEIHAIDCYGQPTGLHYRPHSLASAHQDQAWLDFQWCQTGHGGAHAPQRVAAMWHNFPPKGIANGEPTYENTNQVGIAAGWWQGHEAWINFLNGATMGVFYGAAGLWQWRLSGDEDGHAEYFLAPGMGWRDALNYEGANYVGLLRLILKDLPLQGGAPNWEHVISPHGFLVPDSLYIAYQENGGPLMIMDEAIPSNYQIIDPRDGSIISSGRRKGGAEWLAAPANKPCVYILSASAPTQMGNFSQK